MPSTQQTQTVTPTGAITLATYDVDPAHSEVTFSVRHLMVATVTGRFKTFRGTLALDRTNLALSRIEGDIEVASIDTSVPDRDAHLKSPDFFDAANHPRITFASREVHRVSETEARVMGDLTIRGVTQPLALHVTHEGDSKDPWGNERAGFTAETTINRKDFGLTWNMALETGGVVVSDKVKLTLHVSAVKRKQA